MVSRTGGGCCAPRKDADVTASVASSMQVAVLSDRRFMTRSSSTEFSTDELPGMTSTIPDSKLTRGRGVWTPQPLISGHFYPTGTRGAA